MFIRGIFNILLVRDLFLMGIRFVTVIVRMIYALLKPHRLSE